MKSFGGAISTKTSGICSSFKEIYNDGSSCDENFEGGKVTGDDNVNDRFGEDKSELEKGVVDLTKMRVRKRASSI